MSRPIDVERAVVGASLLSVGLLWLGASLLAFDALAVARTWWPLLLILWGVLDLASHRRAGPAGDESLSLGSHLDRLDGGRE